MNDRRQQYIPTQTGGNVEHYWTKRPSWFSKLPFRLRAGCLLFVILVVCISSYQLVVWVTETGPSDPMFPTPAPQITMIEKNNNESNTAVRVMGYVFVGVVGLALVVGAGSLVVKWAAGAWESLQMARIRVERERIVPKADNGHLYVPRRGGVADVEASPSRRTTKDGHQPEPETQSHRDAVHNLTLMDALRMTGGRATIETEQEAEPPFQLTEGRDNQKWGPVLENDNR